MPPPSSLATATPLPEVTVLLQRAAEGDEAALGQVFAALYPELKRVARSALHKQGRANAMQTTVLLHESYLRLVGNKELRLEDRRHFFAYAARTMRNLIVDGARQMLADCRGAGAEHLALDGDDGLQVADPGRSDEAVLVDEALHQLHRIDPELAELVEMRYFGGYSDAEIAELLGVTDRTVRRRWDKARAWLFAALNDNDDQALSKPLLMA